MCKYLVHDCTVLFLLGSVESKIVRVLNKKSGSREIFNGYFLLMMIRDDFRGETKRNVRKYGI